METIDLDIAANLELGLAESVRYLRDVIVDGSIDPSVRVAAATAIVSCLREPIPLNLEDD